jgi:hypothetical protein
MADTKFNCLPTMIGSMPHRDPKKACEVVAHYLRQIPAWPQLPLRGPQEGMVAQFGEGFPGLTSRENKLMVDTNRDLSRGLEAIYQAYLDGNAEKFPVSETHAAGLYEFLRPGKFNPLAVKGQVTGPVSFCLSVLDTTGKSIVYNETLADAAARLLYLKARWQEDRLREVSPRTIVFVDEPGMASFGSAFFNLPREQVIALIDATLAGITGLKGIHCCGNTDWGLIASTQTDILSFDTYNYGASINLYPEDVKRLIARGGAIAWGIIPNTENLEKESAASLKDRLEESMAPFTRQGMPFAELKEHSLLTPSCSLAAMTEEGAEQALGMLITLSARMRGEASP